jgi:hypothetical protein
MPNDPLEDGPPADDTPAMTIADLKAAVDSAKKRLGGTRRVVAAMRDITGIPALVRLEEVEPKYIAECVMAIEGLQVIVGV